MFKHHAQDDLTFKTYIDWFLLAFLSGSVNTGGFLACGRFVSHVTGFATLFGVDLAHGRIDSAFGILSVPAFFLIGVMLSAWLIDRPIHEGRRPHFTIVMASVFACLFLSMIGGQTGFFGTFGMALKLKQEYILLALLCLASGLQNAAITSATGASIRTTHLTGVTTDLGIGLIRVFSRLSSNDKRKKEIQMNWIRSGTIASFGMGSAVSAVLFLRNGYGGFLLPTVIAFYFTFVSFVSESLRAQKARALRKTPKEKRH